MNKVETLIIFPTYNKLEIVKKTLPSIIKEVKNNDAALIVFDTTDTGNKNRKWKYLERLNANEDFTLILSTNFGAADVRNTCLYLGQQLFCPDYICVLDDDHGFKDGLIKSMTKAMKKYYGKISPNGLRFGLFSGCNIHRTGKRNILPDGHAYPDASCKTGALGGTNGCFRAAPTSHWNNVLEGWGSDEYIISLYQTRNLSVKNYNKGFTTLIIDNGEKGFCVDNIGRGTSMNKNGLKLWDNTFAASDKRAKYIKK